MKYINHNSEEKMDQGTQLYKKTKQLLTDRLKHNEIEYSHRFEQLEDYYRQYTNSQHSKEWLNNLDFLYNHWKNTIPIRQPMLFYKPKLTDLSNTDNLKEFLSRDDKQS